MASSRDQPPAWARSALDSFDAALARGGDHYLALGIFWHFKTEDLGFWAPTGYRKHPLALALSLAWLVGLALLGWAVFALRSHDAAPWRWIAGGLLSLVGALGFALWRRDALAPATTGLLVSPGGLIRLEGAKAECIAREDVEGFEARAGELVAISRTGLELSVTRTPLSDSDDRRLDAIQTMLSSWRRDGKLELPDERGPAMAYARRSLVKATAVPLVVSAVIGAFGYLTLVMPGRTEAASAVEDFLAAAGSGQIDQAYEQLAQRYRAGHQRDDFAAELPAELRQTSGISVNGVATFNGVGGSVQCIDGWLQDVEEHNHFAFALVEEQGEMKILAWTRGDCRFAWWD